MKKSFFCLFLFFLTVLSAYANQHLYQYDDWEYKIVDYLCQVSNVTGPAIVTPVSADVLSQCLEKIDTAKLPARIERLYDTLLEELESPSAIYASPSMFFNLTSSISPEFYFKVGNEAHRNDWYKDYSDRMPILDFSAEFGWSEYVYGVFGMPFKLRLVENAFDEIFSQNIYFSTSELYQRVTPFEAGISVGNSFFNLFIGRNRLNIGRGYSGNLFVADNFQFQDFAKFSFYDDFFSYDFTYTHFDLETGYASNQVSGFNKFGSFNGPHQARVTHSYSFDFVDRVRISINEGAVLLTDSALDIRMLNPFIFLHNWQGFDADAGFWANNFAGLELCVVLGHGVGMDFQLIVDQIQLASEMEAGANMFPNAVGCLLNFSHVIALENSFLQNHIEFVYTSPYLYLNDLDSIGSNIPNEQMDLILGYYLSYGSDISYSGYKYGPDSIVVEIGGNWITYDGLVDLTYLLMYRAHGERGIKYYQGQNQIPESIGGDSSHVYDFSLTGVIEHTFLAYIGLSYKIHESFKLSAGFAWQYKYNYNNMSGSWNNLQCSIGFSFDPMEFLR